ncbi:RNA polymerase primary sigma factor [Parelusimicrobium proximum]|uniref:sigma-70 family RNA polymerase sigma factor n=1 Tax=Parelusimicrobium proximum TaxID=3228953 RepID=UPI003D164708
MDNKFDSTNEYFKKMRDVTHDIDSDSLAKLWKRVKKGDSEARKKMMELNLRLVIPAAKRFRRGDIDLLDLIEEGNLGLLQAIDKFEPAKGFKFSTYAIYWIEQYIRRYIDEQGGAIKIPSHAWGYIKKWNKTWAALKEALGRDPTLNEMADDLGVSARKVKTILNTIDAAKGIDSLASSFDGEDDMTLEDTIADDGSGNPDSMLEKSTASSDIAKALEELNERDRDILVMRHGLDGNEPKTLGEIAEMLNLSRERVRQIEERALGQIRKKAHRLGLVEIRPENRRTQNIHTGMDTKHKTNILGEITDKSPLAKLIKSRIKEAEKNSAKKAGAGKSVVKKSAAKKTDAKKSVAKKSVAKKSVAKKSVAKKAGVKKTGAGKTAPKKTALKKNAKNTKKSVILSLKIAKNTNKNKKRKR